MPATRTQFNFTLTLLHLLLIFTMVVQLAYAAPSPLQDTVVYPNANHHRHIRPHSSDDHPHYHLDNYHHEENLPTNTYETLDETEVQSTLLLGCRRLRLLGVHIRRCAEQMVSVALSGSSSFTVSMYADFVLGDRLMLRYVLC